MKYYTINPPVHLADYVRFFWVLECQVALGDYYVHRSMADGCTELLFHYKGRFDEIFDNDSTQSSFLSGIHAQSRSVRRFKINRDFGIFGAYLYPYAIPHLFNIPASEVTDQMIDNGDFLGAEGRELEEKIILARSNNERVRILTAFLETKLGKVCVRNTHKSIKSVIDNKGQIDIDWLARECFLSRRQFERRFRQLAGFSPKLYARIVRFQSVFDSLKPKSRTLTEVAYRCGYADQSHFIHDFKEFSGYTPKRFLQSDSTETWYWTA